MNVRQLAAKIILDSDTRSEFVDITIAKSLEEHKLSLRDRALLLELVNGVYRWRGKLDWVLDKFCEKGLKTCPPVVVAVLEIALYQLMFLNRIPHYAIINEAVEQIKTHVHGKWGQVVNAVLRNYLRQNEHLPWPRLDENPVAAISILHSHPPWLVERWVTRYGIEETIKLCTANNSIPNVTLRINRLVGPRSQILANITKISDVKFSPYDENFVECIKHFELPNFPPLKEGFCSVQDVSAGLPVRLLDPKPGEKIIDLCAAPGGKTTYIAELSEDRAYIVAIDVNRHRMEMIQSNYRRLKQKSICVVVADGRQIPLSYADKVLVDVPCTGFGVLSKRVDLRWKRKEQDQINIVKLQKELLNSAAQKVKLGGVLVYSTCTIEPEENEDIVFEFLQHNSNFTLEDAGLYVHDDLVYNGGYVKTFPHIHSLDGSFSARLVKHQQ